MLRLTLFLALSLWSTASAAQLLQTPIEINADLESVDLNKALWFLEDHENRYSAEDIQNPEFLKLFAPTKKRSPNFGFTDASVWAKVPLINTSKHTLAVIVSEAYAITDAIDFWMVHPLTGTIEHARMGDQISNDKNRQFNRLPSFQTKILPGQSWLLMRIQTQGSMIYNVTLFNEQDFYRTTTKEYVFLYTCLGILTVMGFYNFFIWLQLRKLPYLIYFGFILTMVGQTLAYSGLLVHFISDYSWAMNHGYVFVANLAAFFACLFPLVFLSLHGRHPWLERFCYLGIFLHLVSNLALLHSYNLGAKTSILAATMASVITLTCGIVCSLKRYRPAYFFTLAWVALIIGNFIRMAMSSGFVPVSFWSEWGVLVGSVIEVVLLSLALADKVRLTEKLAFEGIDRLNQNLERTVAEQTQELRANNLNLLNQKQTIEKANEELKELDHTKTAFFRQVSHELRTPLTLILGSLHFLEQSNAGSEVRTALRNSKRLLRLVNQLLDFQRLTQNKRDESTSVVDMRSLLASITEAFYDAAREHGIHLVLEDLTSQSETPCVKGKIDSLEKIFFNYLANALKYTPTQGRIKILLESHAGMVRVTVEDNGPGIESDQLGSLFEIFKRLPERNGQIREGTGIGLALCKELASSMKGEVGVSSRIGLGSSFWAAFPLDSGLEMALPLYDILFIDDEPAIQMEFAQSMARLSSLDKFMIVGTFEDAELRLRKNRFRCIISDINLDSEKGNGVDLLTLAFQLYPDSVRIIMSADRSGEKLQKALDQARISTMLFKPFTWKNELEKIEKLIADCPMQHDVPLDHEAQRKRSLLHIASVEVEALPHVPTATPTNPNAPTILIVDDLPEMRQLIRRILGEDQFRFLESIDGQEAWKILQNNEAVDLLITDWMMPKISGPELVKLIREQSRFESLPIVLLTAKGDDHSRQLSQQLGANAYVGKPFDKLELLSTVSNLIHLKQREKDLIALQKHVTEHVLKRYLPAGLVEKIVNGTLQFDETPAVKSVTIMFVDICNFTNSSESLGPKRIGRILNSYFTSMSRVIFQHGGTIDKFIGDGIMVVFGAPQELEISDQVQRAMKCALGMFEALHVLNEEWMTQKLPQFKIRIGIHQGPAIVGSFGGSERSDYTVIGPTVNLAARIQAAAEPDSIFVSGNFRDYLEDVELEDVGYFDMKGVTGQQRLFRVPMNQAAKAA